MAKQLLVDYLLFDIEQDQITESMREHDGRLVVKGILQRANSKNQNGRIYPRETLMREAEKYADTYIRERRALGELDHPDSSVVNLNNVSHNVKEMKWVGDDLLGTVEVLSTPAGNILKELFKSGIKLGISSRGLGSVEELKEADGDDSDDENPTVKVKDDFELIAFDFVSNPSTHGAFMRPVHEGVEKSIPAMNEKDEAVEIIINDILRGE